MPPQQINDNPTDDWSMTFAYWGTILVAGILFAVVSLAPKFRALAELQTQYIENTRRLTELERQANDLERIAVALEHDPAFKTQLASAEFAIPRLEGERIAVAEEFRLGAGAKSTEPNIPPPLIDQWSIPLPIIDLFATNRTLRATLLTLAGTLAVFALLFLNEEQAPRIKTIFGAVSTVPRLLTNRYKR